MVDPSVRLLIVYTVYLLHKINHIMKRSFSRLSTNEQWPADCGTSSAASDCKGESENVIE